MIKVAGCNTHRQLVTDVNCKMIEGFPAVCPPQDMQIDASSFLSISLYEDHTVCILKDGKAVAYGNNSGNRVYNTLPNHSIERTEYAIFDHEGRVCKIHSAVCGSCYTLYMAQSSNLIQKSFLVYISSKLNEGQPIFLDIGNCEPVALYGGNTKCAAITSDGSVIIIANSILKSTKSQVHAISLLNDEKAISLACCDHIIYALSSIGHVFQSTSSDSFSSFKIVSELYQSDIEWISGTCRHCLAVSKDGQVYACGSNGYGEIALENNSTEIENFTLIEPLFGRQIKAAYAGYSHSLFQDVDGKILACGNNGYDQMLLVEPTYRNIYLPLETVITKGATFCIAGHALSIVFINCQPPPNCPNQKIQIATFSEHFIEKVRDEENSTDEKYAKAKRKVEKLKRKNEILQIKNDELEAQLYQLKVQIKLLMKINDQAEERQKELQEKFEDDEKESLKTTIENESDEDCEEAYYEECIDYQDLSILDAEEMSALRTVKKLGRGILSKSTKVSRAEFFVLKEFKVMNDSSSCNGLNDLSDDDEAPDFDVEKIQLLINLYETLNKLNHPNIVKVVNFFNSDSKHRHASALLEFCPTTLKDSVKRLSNLERVCIIYEICEAMRSVHRIGIVHRDLKPENILIDASKHVKISDFGATILMPIDEQLRLINAKQIHRSYDRMKLIAPELLDSNENRDSAACDSKVDVYAFGVIVYYTLMKGECPKGSGDSILKGEKSQDLKGINSFTRMLIRKCCATSSASRPSFDDISELIKENDFNLIDGIEKDLTKLKLHLSI